jgi:hypothetical protein
MGLTPSTSSRTVGIASAGLLALALAGVPATATATATAAVPGAAAADVVFKPGTKAATVSTEKQLRTAVMRSNKRDGTQVVRLSADISFAKSKKKNGGAGVGDLDVTDDLVLNGAGQTIDANGVDRIFDVAEGAELVLRNVQLTGGAPAATESGGAISVAGTLKAKGVTLTKNEVTGELASGGAIFNDAGKVVVVKSRLAGNASVRAGGAIEALEGRTVVRGSALAKNSTGDEPGNGGALHLTGSGTVKVSNSKVVKNKAGAEGGGLWNSAEGTMTVKNSVVSQNEGSGAEADQGGGGLYNDGGELRVTGSTVSRNKATGELGSGGGILNVNGTLEVADSSIASNTSKRAGGGIETSAGTVALMDVELVENTTGKAPGNGGGLHATGEATVTYDGGRTVRNKAAAQGGGLWNSETGTLTVTDVTIRKNKASEKSNNYNDGGVFTVDGEPVESGTDDGGGFPLPLPF